MKTKIPAKTPAWIREHYAAGCDLGCFYAETAWLYRGPCCTYPGTLTWGHKRPFCQTRNQRGKQK